MRLVPIRLGDLRYGEEFETLLTHQRGVLVSTGWTWWGDGTERRVRLRAALVRFGTVERVLRAELPVLVEANRPHVRRTSTADSLRWRDYLPEPGELATVGEVADTEFSCESS